MRYVNYLIVFFLTFTLFTQFLFNPFYMLPAETSNIIEAKKVRMILDKGMQSTVLITELGFNSTSGKYEIEIFNNMTTVIFDTDLQVFIDGIYTNTAWSVTTLASKKYAIGSISSPWPDGAVVELRRNDLSLLDSLSYGTKGTAPDPLSNESIARVFVSGEYSNNWTRCSMPTFGRENDNTLAIESQPKIILNEVLFNPLFEKAFVELYYLGNGLVDFSLTNYYLVCDSVYVINSGILSPSNRHLVIYNDSFDTNFNLTSEMNNIYLYSNDGRRLDMLGWSTSHEHDKSVARLHDAFGCYNGFLGNYPNIVSYNSTCYDDTSTILGGWVFNSKPTPAGVNDNLPEISGFLSAYYINDEEELNISINISDIDGDLCTIEIGYSNINASLPISYQVFNISNNSVSILISPTSNNIGKHIFFINVSDGFLFNYSLFEVNIYHVNTPPYFDLNEITLIRNATLGTVYTCDIHAKDNDTIYGDSLTYFVEGPEFFSVNSAGLAIWPVVNVTPGSFVNVNITAVDNFGLSAYLNYSIYILSSQNNPPYFTSDAPNLAYVGERYEYDANASDIDSDILTYTISSIYPLPTNMPTINSETGLMIWEPALEDANKTFSITITVSDSHSFAEQHFEIYVRKKPQPPSLLPIPNIITKEDEVAYLNLSLYAFDPDGDELTFYLISVNNTLFSWSIYNMNLSIIPIKDAFGECTCTLVVFDTSGLRNETSVRLIVLPLNDPPTIFPKIENISISEAQPFILNLANYEKDVDNSHSDLHWQISSPGINLVFEYFIEYTSDSAWLTIRPLRSAQTTLTFYLYDLSAQYATCNVTLTITHVNRAPIIEALPDLQVRFDRSYTFNFTPYIHDEDNETNDLVLSCSTPYATHNLSNSMLVTFNFPSSFQNQTIVVFITVSDGITSTTSTVNITVKGNIPPIVTSPIPDISLDEDTNLTSAIILSEHFDDPDMGRAPLFYSCHGNKNIFVFISESGVVDISPMADWFGIENITFRATDLSGAIAEFTVMVTVKPVNDPPVVLIPPQQGTEGRNWTISLDKYIFDIDNSFSQLTISENSPYVTIHGCNATFSYPIGHRSDFVSFTVSDGINTTVQIVEITIRPNSPPIIGVIPDISVRFGIDYKFSLLPYVSDPDGDVIQIYNVSSNYIKFGDALGNIEGISEIAKQLVIILNYPFNISYEKVTITVWDGSLKTSAEFNVTVSDNYPPIVSVPIPDLYLREDVPSLGALNLLHYFTDPDGDGKLTFTALGWHFIV
ncbi:MAG: tandem-95 repeat protein, partial [Thermoplasmata archaeon]